MNHSTTAEPPPAPATAGEKPYRNSIAHREKQLNSYLINKIRQQKRD